MTRRGHPTLSYCVVNTNGREFLLACLAAIERTHPAGVEREVLVLDNASEDGSADGGAGARRRHPPDRAGAADRQGGERLDPDASEASGRYCLLLNEDSELRPGAAAALIAALDADPRAAAAAPAAARLRRHAGPLRLALPRGRDGARRGALPAPPADRRRARGATTRRVDWAQSSALMVRREAAAEVGYLDPDFFVYYDECDFAKRLADAGWHELFVPAAEAVHHDQLSTDLAAGLPRIVEFHRNRDLYMRKHHGRPAALAVRVLTAWSYAARALAATVPPEPTRPGLPGPRPAGALPEPRRVDPRPRQPRRWADSR